ncbi:Gfo/Idh/MocA family protein [Paenibacillus brevis]|uniref:Gfo/Idh/MocA family oxidoreductase n=1 Tax=Paenibacillus brevis TaxID=2841508 RepID=A0ABS6FV12_9BACL|nr:Gfo/Idh/MocA family oxidoreductase [Paenibacillus brevis]MBU5674078.1 Gfo/Idh/MocA family oxidoreductase [Paenibacillus brevis]
MIKFGLVGCGRIADRHIRSLAECEDAELTALFDVQPERMAAVEADYAKFSGCQGEMAKYTDMEQLLKDPQVQAVIIATPSALHAKLASEAIRSGKHVMLEKPMALSLQDAENIIALAQKYEVTVQVCHQLRYRKIMTQVKELIESGTMGKLYLGVVSMRLQRSAAYYEAAPWRGTWEQDGGMLLNQGIHLVDLLQWFLGDGTRVFGSLQRGLLMKETEDVAAGIVNFKDGAIGMIEANTVTYPGNYDNCITLFGEKGTVSIGGIRLDEVRKWSFSDPNVPDPVIEPAGEEHVRMYERFIKAAKNQEKAVLIDAKEGKRALELIFALYDSALKGRSMPIPLISFHTEMMGDLEVGI